MTSQSPWSFRRCPAEQTGLKVSELSLQTMVRGEQLINADSR